ncbi:competence type IV pilus minor pilin ComGG [Neobacillus jeddahensis]|uniref:competence type IV pilus minor pilin ComGG n=1 Tax=Neobacillus jeddahensis TaxID=1461580 RepID=UPI00058E2132|nr:competence type IV pilus minor pilin ComGG [Neobacillus jeddahensis]
MKNNEQGFTYPLILCLLILFLLFFSMQIELFLTEKKMVHESTAILQQEYYFLSTAKKIEELQIEGNIPVKGTIVYSDGIMTYQPETPTENVQKVKFTLTLSRSDPVSGIGYFDTRTKKLIRWVEANN